MYQAPVRACQIIHLAGVEVDEFGATDLDIRVQTKAVIDNISDILQAVDASLTDFGRP